MNKEWMEFKIKEDCIVLIDSEDLEKIKVMNWHIAKNPDGPFKIVTDVKVGSKFKSVTLARFITNAPAGSSVCFLNSRLDFRKENLVVCNRTVRGHLRAVPRVEKTSKYKGVHWNKNSKKWRATIGHNRRTLHLGLFESEEELIKSIWMLQSSYSDEQTKWQKPREFNRFVK